MINKYDDDDYDFDPPDSWIEDEDFGFDELDLDCCIGDAVYLQLHRDLVQAEASLHKALHHGYTDEEIEFLRDEVDLLTLTFMEVD